MPKREMLTVTIDKYVFEGKGLARHSNTLPDGTVKDMVIFVQHAYPGDVAEVEVRKKKKSYFEATVKNLITPSPLRTKAECSHFGVCGGCRQQDMIYTAQTEFKQEQVLNLFERQSGFTGFITEPILPAPSPYFYRNKMEFTFSPKRWLSQEEIGSEESYEDSLFAGLHVPGVFDKVIDIQKCYLQSESSNKILEHSREFFLSRGTLPYTTRTHTGYLRNLVIRLGIKTNQIMVNLVTASEDNELMKSYTSYILDKVPEITTVINNINTGKASVAVGEYENVFYGPGYIEDIIGHCRFRISPNSFFQTNTLQGENLYSIAREYAAISKDDIVYDLYCGAGTISLYTAPDAKFVYGFEASSSAIKDAAVNQLLNNNTNSEFFEVNLYKSFLPFIEEKSLPRPDIIIADPPRNGMHPVTVEDILTLSPKKLVYISCNPATQARDIKELLKGGYKLVKIRPVDMFPHTYHIENVALLVKES